MTTESKRAQALDLAPILITIALFQFAVLQQPMRDMSSIAIGFLFVVFGLWAFIKGLEMALFPLGKALANEFVSKGSTVWLLTFSFCLGFGTTVAEPALIAVSAEAALQMANAGFVTDANHHANALRYTVALSVGVALVLGVTRILKGWPIHWMIIAGYGIVISLTVVAPAEIVGIAFDSGGVTTSTITVPLVAALGVGLASVIEGRSPMIDGFGLIAFASITPIAFVLAYGIGVAI